LRVEFAGVQVIKTGLGEGWMDGIELQIVRDTNTIRLAFSFGTWFALLDFLWCNLPSHFFLDQIYLKHSSSPSTPS